jgi:hypothetical protein
VWDRKAGHLHRVTTLMLSNGRGLPLQRFLTSWKRRSARLKRRGQNSGNRRGRVYRLPHSLFP